MYIESVPNRSSPPAILLRESFRDGPRVKKRTLANLSKLPADAINALRRILRGEQLIHPDDAFTCLRSLPHGHVAAVLATVRKLGLAALLARSPGRQRDLVLALLVARVIDAQSKLATARALTPETAVSTLGEMLNLGTVDPKELYAAMDWLVERQAAIEQRLAKRHLQENTLVLYDLTSSYVEGTHCELAQRGHSRDRKKGTLQIVFGLLCTATGCPVAVEVFEGSTSDPNTVAAQVDKIRTRFGLHRVVLVGDRGMLTAAHIREDLADVDGLRWITTLRAPTIRKLMAAGTVTPSLFDQHDLAEVTSEDFPGERLIVCRNPLLAAERQRKRHELLAATEKELEPIVAATRRRNDPLRGAADIGIRVGKVINRYKVAKHFVTTITDESFTFRRNEDKIADEEQLDGLSLLSHGISNLGGLNLLCLLEWFCHKSFKTQEIQAVAHHNTVFGQFLALLPRHEFDAESREHQRGQRLRVMSRWAQFVALGLGQVTGRQSLRDIVANLQVQSSKLYHLGVRTVSRSSLARVNAEQPYTLYEAVFSRLLSRCQQQAPGHRFRFKHKLYAVDASTIDLCLALFPWATFRRTKAAVKLHVGLDQAGQLPSFVSLTEGKRGDVTVARTWRFPAGSVVVADRAYLDFKWLHQLQTRSVTFVTRLKRGVRYRVTHEHDFRPETGVLADQRIELTSARSGKAYPDPLRRVVYRDPQTKNRYVFVTNNTTWVAKTIADIYKSRWQIELFFKWIKQHLKVKRFIGRSKNAVWTQLWIATCMYLLLAYLKFVLRLRWSLNQMLQVLQLNIFERRPLHELFTTHAPPDPDRPQLALAWT